MIVVTAVTSTTISLPPVKNDTCSSKFHLVDLAESVRAKKKTQAEWESINDGLLCFWKCDQCFYIGGDKEKCPYLKETPK